jgi:hypothetical protein
MSEAVSPLQPCLSPRKLTNALLYLIRFGSIIGLGPCLMSDPVLFSSVQKAETH